MSFKRYLHFIFPITSVISKIQQKEKYICCWAGYSTTKSWVRITKGGPDMVGSGIENSRVPNCPWEGHSPTGHPCNRATMPSNHPSCWLTTCRHFSILSWGQNSYWSKLWRWTTVRQCWIGSSFRGKQLARCRWGPVGPDGRKMAWSSLYPSAVQYRSIEIH